MKTEFMITKGNTIRNRAKLIRHLRGLNIAFSRHERCWIVDAGIEEVNKILDIIPKARIQFMMHCEEVICL